MLPSQTDFLLLFQEQALMFSAFNLSRLLALLVFMNFLLYVCFTANTFLV